MDVNAKLPAVAEVRLDLVSQIVEIDHDVGEAVRAEPCGNFRQVAVGQAETLAELLWRKPAVVVGRGRVLLFGKKGLNAGIGLQEQRGICDREIGACGAEIGLCC